MRLDKYLLIGVLLPWSLTASDYRTASIVIDKQANAITVKAAHMLSEEVEKRTQLRLPIVHEFPRQGPSIFLGTVSDARRSGGVHRQLTAGKAEGFSLLSDAGQHVTVAGNDDSGVIFGTGYLLRQFRMSRQHLILSDDLHVTTSPAIAVRGHQLGYRAKTNAYDAWNVPMWEQYIRELAIFGTNTIELLPPGTDDDSDSPHFPLTAIDMMAEMSRIAGEYGLKVSIWYPAMAPSYKTPEEINKAVDEWTEVYRKLPNLDAVFVPGGDPGHTQPKYMMALLEKQAARLRQFHPKAEMWVSPQGFDKSWMEEFYSLLDQQPPWLTGVVYGPQVRDGIAAFRSRVPKRYPIRFYPDITHSWRSEFPVPDWDVALAATEGREGINPRPRDEQAIFRYYRPYTLGFVSYSEGCNDDVNKFLWSGLGWNPDADVKDLLREFSRFFIGPEMEEGFASGLLALEQNWRGPLSSNDGVDVTVQQFRSMEASATPQQKLNWRFQQALYRAYYDAYIRSRLRTETQQEEQAMGELRRMPLLGKSALDRAEEILTADRLTPIAREYRSRVYELAEGLYQSIHMQLSVNRYAAIGLERGANLDAADFALNNRVWLQSEFAAIRKLPDEKEQWRRVEQILNWTNPGPGGFYDDLGNPAQQPHLVVGPAFKEDPGSEKRARCGMGKGTPQDGWRTSWTLHIETLYDQPLTMRYTDLDRSAKYKVRVVYAGDMPQIPIGLTANGSIQIHPMLQKPANPTPQEFPVPIEATRGGTLTLEWRRPEGLGGNGRGAEVAEVWLIRLADNEKEGK